VTLMKQHRATQENNFSTTPRYRRRAEQIHFLSVRALHAVMAGAFMLTVSACGTSNQPAPIAAEAPVACVELPSPAASKPGLDLYQLTDGRSVRFEDSEIVLTSAQGEEGVLAKASLLLNVVNVERRTGTETAESERYVVYATPLVDEVESELVAHSLDSDRLIRLGTASTYEFGVHSVWYDKWRQEFVVTATADLTEVVLRVDLNGQEKSVEEPYPYNDHIFMLTAYPIGNDRELYLEAPMSEASKWTAMLLVDGELRAREQIEGVNGIPTGWIDSSSAAEGLLLIETSAGHIVISADSYGLEVRPGCGRPVGARLPR